MKTLTVILAVSLAANVVLVGGLMMGLASDSRSPQSTRVPAATAAPTAAPASPAMSANAWSELRSEDLKEQAEKLRADGFPPSMIRAIIAAQVRAGFAARRKALEASQAEQPFWRMATPDPTTMAALRALSLEEQAAVKNVLGPDPENGPEARLRRQFPAFSDETIAVLSGIRERYDQKRADLFSGVRGPGGMLPDEQAKMEALEKAQHAEIAAALKPHELEEYDLRSSNTANQLRYELAAFDATEQEFRALYQLKRAFDDQWGGYRGMPSEDAMRARSEAQKQLNEQIKAALGPQRFEEYQRASDYNYRQTTQLVARLNLPPQTANSLYTIQKEFEQRRNDLYRTSGGAPGSADFSQMVEKATALQQEAIARVTPVLGSPQHVDAYKQYGGSWITSMVPRPPPPAPPRKS